MPKNALDAKGRLFRGHPIQRQVHFRQHYALLYVLLSVSSRVVCKLVSAIFALICVLDIFRKCQQSVSVYSSGYGKVAILLRLGGQWHGGKFAPLFCPWFYED
jgi:hypothetical protein